MADRTVAIVTASSNSGFQCLQDLMAYKGDLELKIKAAFRTEERAEEYMEKLSPGADTRKVEVVTGVNALQKESLAAAFADAEIAVIVTPHDPALGTMERDSVCAVSGADISSDMCLNMVEAAVASGTVKHIIYVSSWSLIARNELKAMSSRFVATEERLEDLAQRRTATFTFLRAGFFNQNFATLMGSMARAGTIAWPDVKIPSVDPRDMGSVAAAICTSPTPFSLHGGKCYQISGPDVLSTKQVVETICGGLGLQPDAIRHQAIPLAAFLEKVPFAPVREIFATMEARPDLIPFSKDTELVTGDQRHGPARVLLRPLAGKPARSLKAWVEEHKAAFLP